MKRYCYDCGNEQFEPWENPGSDVCVTCGELVYVHERIGLVRAFVRRRLFPWHSNTQDPNARGWRKRS